MSQVNFSLPSLPYDENALAPYISAETLNFHYKKHHQAYVTKLNELMNLQENADFASKHKSLEDIIMNSYSKNQGIFNNAGQVWNHTFYWHSMKHNGGGEPVGSLRQQIESDFGDFEKFKDQFIQYGMTQFGSGWVWLVWNLVVKKLEVMKTPNAELPMVKNMIAIVTSDVWEHAYYLDYQNRRADYLATFIEKLVNWEFASKNFDSIIR